MQKRQISQKQIILASFIAILMSLFLFFVYQYTSTQQASRENIAAHNLFVCTKPSQKQFCSSPITFEIIMSQEGDDDAYTRKVFSDMIEKDQRLVRATTSPAEIQFYLDAELKKQRLFFATPGVHGMLIEARSAKLAVTKNKLTLAPNPFGSGTTGAKIEYLLINHLLRKMELKYEN